MKTRKHAKIVSGSTARLRRMCNKSIDESEGVPPSPPNIYSATGTTLHSITEIAMRDGLSNKVVRKRFTGAKFRDLLDDDATREEFGYMSVARADIDNKAIPALEFMDELLDGLHEPEVFYERRVHLPEVHNDAHGIGDVFFRETGKRVPRAGYVDFKFGDGILVPAADNDQIRFYLSAAIGQMVLPEVSEYEAYIFQPAEKLSTAEYVKKAVYTLRELDDFVEDLRDSVNAKKRVHNPGEWCRWCPGKIKCKAFKQAITRTVESDIPGLSTKQIADMLDFKPAADQFFKDLYEAALRNAQNRRKVPGYGLKASLGDRFWKDEDAAWGAMGRLGIAAADRTVKKPITPAEFERQAKALGIEKDEIDRFTKRHTDRTERGERLVKMGDDEPDGESFEALGKAIATLG